MAAKPEEMLEHCDACGAQLEIGQIGKCDDCQEAAEPQWTNHYLCPCGEHWEDQWDCRCNDRCPKCNKEIEPYISNDGSVSDEEIDAGFENAKAAMGLTECAVCDAISDVGAMIQTDAGLVCCRCHQGKEMVPPQGSASTIAVGAST